MLVVDDHPTNREVLVRQLQVLGVAADATADGQEALEAWERGGYAIIFADIHMPRMDGFEMTAIIRRREAEQGRQRTPIVAVTANALPGEDEPCREAGMDGYLSKPVSLSRLRATLQRWLRDTAPAIDPEVLADWLPGNTAAQRDLLGKFSATASSRARPSSRRWPKAISRPWPAPPTASRAARLRLVRGRSPMLRPSSNAPPGLATGPPARMVSGRSPSKYNAPRRRLAVKEP